MYKPVIHSYWLKSNFEYHRPIEILVDKFINTPVSKNNIRIVIIQEPRKQGIIDAVKNKKNYDCYTYVFTYHQEILDNNDKAIHFLCAPTWIKGFNDFSKEFGVSTVVGGKDRDVMDGYSVRHALWQRQSDILIPKDFYLSSAYKYKKGDYKNSLVLPEKMTSKSIMFGREYHIAIENTNLRNAFSEKIVDCFRTKTIPIHYGTPNIGEFFNLVGIIVVNSVDDIIDVCNGLKPDMYKEKLSAVEDNYTRSEGYLSATEILDKKLNEVLNNGKNIFKN